MIPLANNALKFSLQSCRRRICTAIVLVAEGFVCSFRHTITNNRWHSVY